MNIERYTIANLKMALRNPSVFLGLLSTVGQKINIWCHDRFKTGEGTCVMEEDWDNLLILDGCRYDMFPDQLDISGRLQQRISHGSESLQFIRENFIGQELHDTVYITANPYLREIPDGTFHATSAVFRDGWNEELETVPPNVVVKRALEAHTEFPNKRLIVHFIQPHYPFIGDIGKEFDQRGFTPGSEQLLEGHPIWTQLRYNLAGISEKEAWKAYKENLNLVLDPTISLSRELNGKTVITSDHGNLVGERLSPIPVKGYGHPPGLRAEELVQVPWYILESDTRRTITSDPPVHSATLSDESVDQRLKALGYV